jgi:hypothetical protein
MAEHRLKIKIGEHEFEAEGPAEVVQSQFETFKNIITTLPERKAETIIPNLTPNFEVSNNVLSTTALDVDRIFRTQGRVISLTVPPSSETDAVLLILYGQKHYRKNENPTGSEVKDGMEQSGYRSPRIGRILGSLFTEGAIIITGKHRGKRYRLTNQGFTRAEAIVRDALAKLP